MAKKGKAKISKVKRNNQTSNKMRKAGQMKLQRHGTKVQKPRQKQPQAEQIEYSSESEPSGDEWADMLDDDEQKYIMSRIAKNPSFLSSVPTEEPSLQQSKKRKRQRQPKPEHSADSGAETDSSSSDVEDKYEKELRAQPAKKLKMLLPIKTKDGLVERTQECPDSEEEEKQDNDVTTPDDTEVQSDSDPSDSGLEGTEPEHPDSQPEDSQPVTTVQLLAARRDTLAKEKLRIGALCSALLESPDKKLKNLFPILYLMEERARDGAPALLSVRRLATLSALEVFRDVLPDYQLRHQDYSNVKLKKDTLSLYKGEKELLEFYKRYLQRLERAAAVLRLRRGDHRKPDEATISLALVSLRCLCALLVARPQFNYAVNIAQSVVPLLGSKRSDARDVVTGCCEQVFQEDRKGDITLTIVRLINQLVKKRGGALPPAALRCLLALRLRDVDLDAAAQLRGKQRTEEKKKKRIVNLSKKEKKRAKKMKEVERELLETAAAESSLARKQQMTEVTRTVFHIYFRVLKTSPGSQLLEAVLEGVAKFATVINLELYSELVSLLTGLSSRARLSLHSSVLCARAALGAMAAAEGVDPSVVLAQLYGLMLQVHIGCSPQSLPALLSAVSAAAARHRALPAPALAALGKRLATAALQQPPHAAAAALVLLRQMTQQSKPVAALLSPGEEAGARFDPLLASPAHCGAQAAGLLELTALRSHYHPAVRAAAAAVAGEPNDITRLSVQQILTQYDGSTMSFKPAIPARPAAAARPARPAHAAWARPALRQMCRDVEDAVRCDVDFSELLNR